MNWIPVSAQTFLLSHPGHVGELEFASRRSLITSEQRHFTVRMHWFIFGKAKESRWDFPRYFFIHLIDSPGQFVCMITK